MASAPQHEMPLLCELGWHKADPLARWNAGYYFSTCGRCGRDLVRTAYGGWRVPKGFKVVWQAQPPESLTPVELVPEAPRSELPPSPQEQHEQIPEQRNADNEQEQPEQLRSEPDQDLDEDPDQDRNQMELPISEVLRHLEAEEQPAYPGPFDGEDEPSDRPPTEPADEHPTVQELAGEAEAPQAVDPDAPAGAAESEPPADPVPGLEPEAEQEAEEAPEAEAELASEPEPEPQPEQEADSLAEPEPEPEPDLNFEAELAAAAAASAAAKVPPADDFMEDDWFVNDQPGYEDWDRAAEHDIDTIAPEIVDDEKEHVGNRSGKIRYGKEVATVAPAPATFLNMLRPSPEEVAAQAEAEEEEEEDEEDLPPAPRRSSNMGAILAVAASLVLLMLIVALGSGWEIRRSDPAMVTSAASEPAAAAQGRAPQPQPEPRATDAAVTGFSEPQQTGFVTASLLNCRTAPAEQAEPVRILRRGDSVEVLAIEPEWASISHRGRQCWASTRYLSAQQPL
jgi:hypothetical protein